MRAPPRPNRLRHRNGFAGVQDGEAFKAGSIKAPVAGQQPVSLQEGVGANQEIGRDEPTVRRALTVATGSVTSPHARRDSKFGSALRKVAHRPQCCTGRLHV